MRGEDKTAVLLIRESPGRAPDPSKMNELGGLAQAAGYRVLAEISQRRSRGRSESSTAGSPPATAPAAASRSA